MQWISYELYGAGLTFPFIAKPQIFETMHRAVYGFGNDVRGREIVYWQRWRDRLSGS